MKHIFAETLDLVRKGANYRINFKTRSLVVGGKKIITNGEYEGSLGIDFPTMEGALKSLEDHYVMYCFSVPSARSDSKKTMFKALPLRELSKEDIMYGEDRYYALCVLELHLLLTIISGVFTWNLDILGERSKIFWQSPNIRKLILFRDRLGL